MKSINQLLFFTFILFFCLFSNCSTSIDKEEEGKRYVVDYYWEKYGFSSEPFYQPIFDEYYNDTIHRYYWELTDNALESQIELFFNPFDKESLTIIDEEIKYSHFGVIFNSGGKVLQKGFFDDSLRFSGTMFHYYWDELLINKDMYKLDDKFYEVFYQLDTIGNIIDSSYKYFLIVQPDKDTFRGPDLSICFDVQLIIDTNTYNYEDFELFYTLLDTPHHLNPQLIDQQKDKIFENLLKMSSDGYFSFCHDLKVKHHLMMVFGVLIESGISDQDLSFGEFHGPIINKNIDSAEF